MSNCFLSVVVAAKDPDVFLLNRCLSAFAALRNAKRMQIVVVLSGKMAEMSASTVASFHSFKVIEVEPKGIYSAYNAGVPSAEGRYVLFFGIDDIALPDMDFIIDQLEVSSIDYTLFAAACYMQSVGVHTPSAWHKSLIFKNWCHQGIFYSKIYLLEHPYQTEYIAQADHKLNIDIVSDRAFTYGVSSKVVSYFSAGGISSMHPDLLFRRDFPYIVSKAYGTPYGVAVKLKQVAIDLLLGPPEKRFKKRPS